VGAAWAGVALALGGLALGPNRVVAATLWGLYVSFVNVGQVFWGFGWELLLLETGFLTIWLAPGLGVDTLRADRPPSAPILWLFRWLGFRLMFGAGLIKLRGDACWRELSCLDSHFETQPLPNPLSPWFHRLPEGLHHAMVGWNHVVELIVPFLLFGPRPVRTVAALVVVQFQLTLILSGNLAFFNWLTIVVALSGIDDRFWARLLPRGLVGRATAAETAAVEVPPRRRWLDGAVVLLVAVLSVQPVLNLLSPQQRMNASFDRWKLVNTYGAFGSVGRTRDELVLEGQAEAGGEWRAYELPCKPGALDRRPCFVAPFQLKLDWQIWFAAMQRPGDHPWLLRWMILLLRGESAATALLAEDPFEGRAPHAVRARLYTYRFAPADSPDWWERSLQREWLPPLSLDDPAVDELIRRMGWDDLAEPRRAD
jgi:hypothetical protein